MVHGIENETLSYDYVLEIARDEDNKRAIDDLTRIGRPPYKSLVSDMMVERKWLKKYGGVEKKVNTLKDMILASIFSPEYTGIDGIKLALGSKFSADTMFPNTFLNLDIIKDIPEVKVPVYFCVGRYDYNTPFALIEKYYNVLVAPEKEFIWFDESAHFPNFEEPEKFAEIAVYIKKRLEE